MEESESEFVNIQARLRGAALLYKELVHRHDPTMDIDDRIHKLIYFLKPESIYTKDPDVQAEYRENFIERLSEVPLSPEIPLYADQLLQEFLAIPSEISAQKLREKLSAYFQLQVDYLHSLKLKLLLQWAYCNEFLEPISIDDQINSLDLTLSDYAERLQRLCNDEDYGKDFRKPVPKTQDGTDLYLFADNTEYLSVSAEDIQVFITNSVKTHQHSRKFEVLLIHLKWLSHTKRFEIWEKMVEKLKGIKDLSVNRMKIVIGKDLSEVYKFLGHNKKKLRHEELPKQEEEVEMPHTLINNINQLQGIVMKISKEFGLKGEMELDDGHSLAYQVTHIFPELFELQKLKLNLVPYGDMQAKQQADKKLQNIHFMKSHRLTSIRKTSSYSEADAPILKSFKIAFKKKADWLNKSQYKPYKANWEVVASVQLSKLTEINNNLVKAFDLIDNQDISIVNNTLEVIVSKYMNLNQNSDLGLTESQDLSNKKKYFSILLAENITKVQTSEVKLPSQIIKTLYTLVLLKNRTLKNKIIDVLNVFRSFERRVIMDMEEGKGEECREIKGRRDLISEIDNDLYVMDDHGGYIVYDVVIDDYGRIRSELMKLGSFYIEKYAGMSSNCFLDIDTHHLASELLEFEYQFQYAKYQLLSVLFYFYNNTIDKSHQSSLRKFIIDMINMKPRLNLRNSYIYESYQAHLSSLNSQISLLNAIKQAYPQGSSLISPLPFNILDLYSILSQASKDLMMTHKIESSKHQSLLESSIWDYAYSIWKDTIRNSLTYFNAGILIDKPELVLKLFGKILQEYSSGEAKKWPKIEQADRDMSEISLVCNYVVVWELRMALERYLEESEVLSKYYISQCELVGKEMMTIDCLDWNKIDAGFWQNAGRLVDEGPGSHSVFNLAVFEIDKFFKSYMNFSDLKCLEHFLTPWGVEEIFTATRYQIMHTQALSLLTQINQHQFDSTFRIVSELKCGFAYDYIPNVYYANWSEILKQKEFDLTIDIRKHLSKLSRFGLSLQQIKLRSRGNLTEKLKILSNIHSKGKKELELAMLTRRIRTKIISEYTFEVLKDLYPYALKVQTLHILKDYKKLTAIIPGTSFKDFYKPDYFYDSERGLLNFSVIPTIQNLLDFPSRAIEDLSINLHGSNPDKSIFSYSYYWNLSHDLMKILQGLGAIVQCLQIRVFLNFLSVPSTEVVELSESIQAGELFYRQNVSDNTVQNSQTMIEDQISDAFSILKSLNENLLIVDKEERTSLAVLTCRLSFSILAITLYSMGNYLLQNNRYESVEFVRELRKKVFNYKTEVFTENGRKVWTINKVWDKKIMASSVWLSQLDYGLIEITTSERSRGLTIMTAIQIRMENLFRIIQKKAPVKETKSMLEALKQDIKLWRLKYNFINITSNEYETAMQNYKELIEDKAEKLAHLAVKNKDSVKIEAEINYLREHFITEMCRSACLDVEKEISQINKAAMTSEAYGVIVPHTSNEEFVRKVTLLNSFLNLFRNRGTVVTAPGGKAIVYTTADLTNLSKRFADQTLRFKEADKRDTCDKIALKLAELKEKIIRKQKELEGYKKLKSELEVEVSNMVNAKLTQKGAQIMYEMDVSQRQLKEIKENTNELEIQVKQKITKEYENKVKEQLEKLRKIKSEFAEFQKDVSSEFRKTIEESKNDGIHELKKFVNFIEKSENSPEKETKKDKDKGGGLVFLQESIRKLRECYQWSRLREAQKFEKNLNELKEQLTSNQYLKEQLTESQARESLLKQELSFTQQALQSTEKLSAKLQRQIREMKSQQQQLQSFKTVTDKKLTELQTRVNTFKNFNNIDRFKLETERIKHEKLLSTIRNADLSPIQQYQSFHNSNSREIQQLKQRIISETKIFKDCVEQIKILQGEIEGIEFFEDEKWRKKYYQLIKEHNAMDRSTDRVKNFTPQPFNPKRTKVKNYLQSTTPQKSSVSFRS